LVKQRCFLKKCVPFEIQMVKSARFPEYELFGRFSLPLARLGRLNVLFAALRSPAFFLIFFKKRNFYEKYPSAAARPAALPARPIPNRHQ